MRSEQPGDATAVRDLLVAAFGGTDEAALVAALRQDPQAWLPRLSLVADDGRSVVGSLVLSRADVGGRPVLALAPLAVSPGRQGEGIGTALVREGLRRARAAGEHLVVVLGDPAYYARFGFVPARDVGVSGPYGDGPQFRALALAEPAPRGALTYAAAFSAF